MSKAAAMAISRSRSLWAMLLLILAGSTVALLGAAVWAVGWQSDAAPRPGLTASATSAPAEDDPSNSPSNSLANGVAATAPAPTATAPSANALDAQAALMPAPLSGIRLARQSLKRGGLGSRVRATFTVRNRHDFAIKDVEIQCAFRSRNGYTTQRRHVLHDTIEPRSRETFSNVLVGHINVTTTRGRCKLLGAQRA
uniref:Uncharacterized protein n=1 Tax=Rhodopseudomonas palustris (strain BisA53) TaxID=316055 RepID=Q07N45_RHOP5